MRTVNNLKWSAISLAVGLVLLCTATAFADTDENQSAAKISVGAVKAGSLAQSIFDPANGGVNTGSVNLYTGQHEESFPLISMPGRGGLGFEVSLDYSGIAYRQAKKENRKGQSSDFGLGFSIGLQSIVVDHKGTLDIADDEYRLIAGSAAIELRKKSDTQYVTITGDPWIINKHVTTVNGRTLVTGWTIIKEDGTISRYGDFSTTYSGWNATRQMLRYGDFIGNGITNTDSLYPYQWDLKVVHDRDSLNRVAFTYVRDQRSVQVRNAGGSLDTSRNRYTAASHLGMIQTSDGNTAQLFYSGRNDANLYFGLNNQEFIAYQRCDSVIARASDSSVVTRLKFEYSYLNSSLYASYGAPFEKLLLRRIRSWSTDNNQSLPPLAFDYDSTQSSPTLGAMVKIRYPSGGIKRIGYNALASGSNFVKLDAAVISSSGTKPRALAVDNMFVVQKSGSNWILGMWDGYWKTTSVTASSANDRAAVSPAGWAVIPASAGDSSLCVYRWKGGYWIVDTLANGPARSVSPNHVINVYPGRDCFIAVNAASDVESAYMTEAKYYRWNGSNWKSFLIYRADTVRGFENIRMPSYLFLFNLSENTPGSPPGRESYIVYGRYDPGLDTVFVEPRYVASSFFYYEGINGNLMGGHNYGAWLEEHATRWRKWDGATWTSGASTTTGKTNSFAELPNGWAWNRSADSGFESHLMTFSPSGNNNAFDGIDSALSPSETHHELSPMWGGNNAIGARYTNLGPDTYLFKWNGTNWIRDFLISNGDSGTAVDMENFGSSWVYGPQRNASTYQSTVCARPFLGNANGWSTTQTTVTVNTDKKDGFAATPEYFLCRSNHQNLLYLYDMFKDSVNWKPHFINSDSLPGSHPFRTSVAANSCWQAANTSFTMWNCTAYLADSTWVPNPYPHWNYFFVDSFSYSAYRLHDTLFAGVAPAYVVDSVMTYRFADDQRPVIQKYKYYGGLLDASATTPRFARSEVSTPYYADSVPVGYEVHCFYNDVDTSGFYDPSIYSSMSFPSLTSSTRYGIANGGFRLDGTEYLSYSYTVGDSPSKRNDTTRTYHSIHKSIDSLPDVYLTRIDSVHSRTDSLAQDVSYKYDDSTGQVTSTRTRYIDSSRTLVDSVIYAYRGNSQIRGDNALALVKDNIRLYDSTSGVKVLARSRATYVRKGGWKASKSYTWRIPSTLTDTIYSDSLLSSGKSFDSVGNVVVSINGMGDTSCVKFDAGHSLPVATATNAGPWDMLVQDLEQPSGWDGWDTLQNGTAVTIVTDSPFTGAKSLKLHCTPNSGQKVEALYRKILKDSLTDTLYALSYWIRANHRAYFRVKMFGGGTLQDSAVAVYTPATTSSGSQWKQVNKVIKIPRYYTDIPVDSVVLKMVSDTVTSASFDTSYVVVDNIRFHRVGAQVATSVYGQGGTLVSASLGPDNVPVRSDFDKFLRPLVGRNFRGDTLSKTEVFFNINTVADSIRVHCDSPTTDSLSTIIVDPCTVTFTLKAMYGISPTPHAYLYKNGTQISHITASQPDVEVAYSSSFSAVFGDTIKVKVFQTSADASATSTARFTRWVSSALPNYARRTNFKSNTQSIVGVLYTDGFGRTIETRTRDSINEGERAIVSGLATYDARGRVVKSYKPYHDLVGSTGLMDYSPWNTAMSEVREYYDGNPGPNCDTFPYSEKVYEATVGGKLKETAGPGTAYRLGAGHTSRYRSGTDVTRQVAFSAASDPDSIPDTAEVDQWGRWSKSIDTVRTSNGTDTLWTVKSISYKDIQGRETLVGDSVLSASTSTFIPLRRSYYNDLGQEDSTWKVDYGTIRMKYDRGGRLRFMQNDLRKTEHKFVYFKYDALGRKIEEGLMGDTLFFNSQDSADSKTYPTSANNPSIKYQWWFDYYNDTLWSPGKLVCVADSGGLYYRTFQYYPTGDSDRTTVRLPGFSDLKIITHIYNRDGSLKALSIRPKHGTSEGTRTYMYDYDAAGRLKTVRDDNPPVSTFHQHFAEYRYNADGSMDTTRLGVSTEGEVPYYDTVQVVNFKYDELGRLISQNDTTGVVGGFGGGGAGNDHFGQRLTYHADSNGYYNGRLYENSSATSSGSSALKRRWRYGYNSVGWLTNANADDTSQFPYDQRFEYDWLGRRTKSVTYNASGTPSTVLYTYDSSLGSAKLIRYSTMPPGKYLRYDVLGNLTSDSARNLLQFSWDYRNLMTQATMPGVTTGWYNTVDCRYDEAGNRLRKSYTWTYWVSCGGPGPRGATMISGPGGSDSLITDTVSGNPVDTFGAVPTDSLGGVTTTMNGGLITPLIGENSCPTSATSGTFYLYDQGNLLATFDAAGNVVDMYVVGPGGNRIATYYLNSDSSLNYFMPDHLGSTRVALRGVPPASTYPITVSAYYNYLPFGGTQEAVTNYSSPNQWTNHEHDQHGSFDYYNFGARLYDPKVGLFLTPDKAGQFASGYVYGGNSPTMGTDPNGNFFLFMAPFWWGVIQGGLYSAGAYSAVTLSTGQDWTGKGFANAFLGGAIGAGIGGTVSSLGGKAMNSFGAQFAINQASSVASNAAMGQSVTWKSILANSAGSLASTAAFGKYTPKGNSKSVNAGGQLGHSILSGITSASVGRMSFNALKGQNLFKGLDMAVWGGAIGGASVAGLDIGLHGTMLAGPETEEENSSIDDLLSRTGVSRPEYRSGGLMGWISGGRGSGVYSPITGKAYIYDTKRPGIWLHETAHHVEMNLLGNVVSQIGRYFKDRRDTKSYIPLLNASGIKYNGWYAYSYYTPGTLEWLATFVEEVYGFDEPGWQF